MSVFDILYKYLKYLKYIILRQKKGPGEEFRQKCSAKKRKAANQTQI